MSRTWIRRNSRNGIEYGGSASQYYWNYPTNPGAYFDPSLGTYDLALPNCTTYAYGRILEAGDPAPITGWHNAAAWHAYLTNGWTYAPFNFDMLMLGDIVEWSSNGRNHVAVVEEIDRTNRLYYVSQSLYTDDNGGTSGYRSPAVWGTTKQSVSDHGITYWPNRCFMFSGWAWVYDGAAPDYILMNPNSRAAPAVTPFAFFGKRRRLKRRMMINV